MTGSDDRQSGRSRGRLEMWGGVECTMARVGDRYRDQVRETGHFDRIGDLDLVAELGIRTLRYPVLWEAVAPDGPDSADYGWHDVRLARLRQLGIEPIVGLIHHGSGPRRTDLLDPHFPQLLARHAALTARRYPWVRRWTPVNEPLTTARFSCLYAHWYPHRRSEADFLRALAHQCRAVLLAMREIRAVVPDAELVQTDDLGRVFSTPALAYQAEYEDERRWLSFDLLGGRVGADHPWHERFVEAGVPEGDLHDLASGEARPDLLGINHYLTSDRFLDEHTERYPDHLVGGNGQDVYADVEAVRVPDVAGLLGPGARLREAWQRYGLPLALTEIHHGCTRDEQVRWLAEAWRDAEAARRDDVDVRAVTAWSLFGTVDWNSLLTRETGIYEPGAFDVRSVPPRPTALASAIRQLAATGRYEHPVLDVPGWWRRAGRVYVGAVSGRDRTGGGEGSPPRAMLVVGRDTPLRRALVRVAAARGLELRMAARGAGSGASDAEVWAVIGLTDRDDAGRLADQLTGSGRPVLVIATGPEAGRRHDRAEPAGAIGAGPQQVLVVRAGWTFGPWDRGGDMSTLLDDLAAGHVGGPPDDVVAPAYLPDLLHVALDMFLDGVCGRRDLRNGTVRRTDLARMVAARIGLDIPAAASNDDLPSAALEAAGAAQTVMPPLASALDRFLADCEFPLREAVGPYRVAAE